MVSNRIEISFLAFWKNGCRRLCLKTGFCGPFLWIVLCLHLCFCNHSQNDYITTGIIQKYSNQLYMQRYFNCKDRVYSVGETILLSDPGSVFLILKYVERFILEYPDERDGLFGFNGTCSVISEVSSLLEKHTYLLYTDIHYFNDNQSRCCLLLNSRQSDVKSVTLSLDEGLQKVLLDTLSILGWNTTCILYDSKEVSKLDVVINLLHTIGVRYKTRLVQDEGIDENILDDCLWFQEQYGFHFISIFSRNNFKRQIQKLGTVSAEFQGLNLTSQWLFLVDGSVEDILRGFPFLHTSLLSINRTYRQIDTSFQLKALTDSNNGAILIPVGRWDTSLHFQLISEIFPKQKYNLNGARLIVATKQWPPFINKETNREGNITLTGFCIDMLIELSRKLNFSYVFVEPKDNEWGRIYRGQWTGLMGQVVSKEADMMLSAISIQQEREEAVDFSYSFFYDYKSFILKREGHELSKHWASLINPFDMISLMTLILSVPLTAAILCFMERVRSKTEETTRVPRTNFDKFTHCLLYLYGALLSEGGDDTCHSVTARTVIAFWWLFSIVAGAIYTGSLVATRTISEASPEIQTIQDLTKRPDYRWGFERGDYLSMLFPYNKASIVMTKIIVEEYKLLQSKMARSLSQRPTIPYKKNKCLKDMLRSAIPKYQDVWRGIVGFNKTDPTVFSTSYAVHSAAVNRGKYAYFSDYSFLAMEAAKNCNSLHLATERFLPMHFGIGFQHLSTLRPLFSKEIMAFHETGLISAWNRRWWSNAGCSKGPSKGAKSVLLYEIQGAYYVLLALLFISITVLLAEILASKFRRYVISEDIRGEVGHSPGEAGRKLTSIWNNCFSAKKYRFSAR